MAINIKNKKVNVNKTLTTSILKEECRRGFFLGLSSPLGTSFCAINVTNLRVGLHRGP